MLQRLKTFLSGDYVYGAAAGQLAPPCSKTPRILVVRAGAIGDTLMVTPLLRALRVSFPNAHLVFLGSETARDVVRYNPHVDQTISLAFRHVPVRFSPEKMTLIRNLKSLHLDGAIVLESHRSFLALACRSNAARLIAYGTLPGCRIERILFDPSQHSIENNLRAGTALGATPAGLEMEMRYPPAVKAALQERLSRANIGSGERLVGIHAGWGSKMRSPQHSRLRSWPPERFGKIAQWLTETLGVRVVLTGSPADRDLNEYIARHAGVPCLNLAGELSLLELAALIDRLDLYVSIESGPAHMAAALGTPLVALLGPAIFQQTRPLGRKATLKILRHAVPCAPCYGTPLMKSCTDNVCMKKIDVLEVQEAISLLLGASGTGEVESTLTVSP